MDATAATELTDLRAALDALRESEGRFRAAFEENPETIGIFRPVLDAEGRFLDAELLYENRIGRERYYGGLQLSAIAGSRQFERWPQSRPLLYDLFARFVDHGAPTHGQLHGIRNDGEYWADISLFRFEGGFVLVGRDVTARVLAQRAAQELDTRYRSVLDAMLDGVVILDPIRGPDGDLVDLRCSYLNQASITGPGSAETYVGTSLLELWPDLAAVGLLDGLREVLATGRPLTIAAAPYRDPGHPDDAERVLDLRVTRVGDQLVGTWRDVTEQTRTADALEASEARYAQVVGGIPVGVYRARTTADGHARWDYISAQGGRVLGVSPEVLVHDPRRFFELIHPDDRQHLVAGNARAHRERQPVQWDLRVRDGDGWRSVRFVNEPAHAEGHEQVWHGFVEDITEQRRTARALEASEARYAQLVDGIPVGVYRVIGRADGSLRFEYLSAQAGRILDLDPDAVVADAGLLIARLEPQSLQSLVAANAAAFASGDAFSWEGRAWIRGEARTIRAVSRPGPRLGDEQVWHGFLEDITERRRLEAEQRRFSEELERRVAERTKELEAANEELRSFSYSVSHDLRAPVRAVAGFARILQRDLADKLDEDALHKLDNIITAGQAMGRLIDDLLSYTRVGQGAVHREPVPLEPVVVAVRIALAERLADSGGELLTVEPLATPLGDRSLIDRILLNLVDNAIAYRRPGVPPRIRLEASEAGDRVTIAVTDNGIGIPADAFERIFEVFTRLAADEEASKSGIGLATVRKAARAMGAEVTVSSVVGEGSTFRFTLPAADGCPGASPA